MDDTRLMLMGRITFELQRFKEHNDHVEWWKKLWPEMKKKLLSDQVIIRWDFIGKWISFYLFSDKILCTRKLCP
jgi:hypothetical protein